MAQLMLLVEANVQTSEPKAKTRKRAIIMNPIPLPTPGLL
jgi:hypothetical protein